MKLSKTKAKINAVKIGDEFMFYNESLTHLDLPKVTYVGNDFMVYNKHININDLTNQ